MNIHIAPIQIVWFRMYFGLRVQTMPASSLQMIRQFILTSLTHCWSVSSAVLLSALSIQNKGHLGSRYMYIFKYIYMYMYIHFRTAAAKSGE